MPTPRPRPLPLSPDPGGGQADTVCHDRQCLPPRAGSPSSAGPSAEQRGGTASSEWATRQGGGAGPEAATPISGPRGGALVCSDPSEHPARRQGLSQHCKREAGQDPALPKGACPSLGARASRPQAAEKGLEGRVSTSDTSKPRKGTDVHTCSQSTTSQATAKRGGWNQRELKLHVPYLNFF